MKPKARKRRVMRLLRSVLPRAADVLTSKLDREGRRPANSLSLVPHQDVRQAITETFNPLASDTVVR
jgi:hypothetical protein